MSFLRTITCTTVALLCASLMQAQSNVQTLNLAFTTIDVPGAMLTSVQGVNGSGDMVGYYGDSNSGPYHGFSFKTGSFTFFDYPGLPSTVATGINDSGLIVGYAGSTTVDSFSYDGNTFTKITDGSNSATLAMGLNNGGDIAGGAGTVYTTKGFEMRGGHFKGLSPPGIYTYVYATGINNLGEVVGWTDTDGFAYSRGKFKRITFPGASQTEAWDVNDSALIIGWYASSDCICGFASKNGKYFSFRYPAAAGTFPRGINKSGQIVGEYTVDYQTYHGFVTSPLTATDLDRPPYAD